MKKFSKGFTLIELIVVIAIIAILAGLILIRIGNASSDARNSKRQSDLNQIRSAIERYKAAGGTCTGTLATANNLSTSLEGASAYFRTSPYPSSYLQGNAYPKDPQTNANYTIADATNDTVCDYVLSATGEGQNYSVSY